MKLQIIISEDVSGLILVYLYLPSSPTKSKINRLLTQVSRTFVTALFATSNKCIRQGMWQVEFSLFVDAVKKNYLIS